MRVAIFQRLRRLVFGGGARSWGGGLGERGAGVGSAGSAGSALSAESVVEPWMDLGALMAIESLELRVRHGVRGVSRGIHRSLRRGTSAEFSEYRPYLPGDDLRHLDWRRMARTNRALVKQYEDEAEWTAMVVLDLSASMGLGSAGYSKGDYARTFGGTLGMFLQGQGDAVGLVRFGKSVEVVLPATPSKRRQSRWWSVMAAEPAGEGSCLGEALEVVRRVQRRPALVIVLSDFLMSLESWEPAFRQLRASGHQVVLVEVLDAQETEFGFTGDKRFEGLEGGPVLEMDPAQVRESYLSRFRAHREAVEEACRREGGMFWRASTTSPLEGVLRPVLEEVSRLRRGRGR
jgi:uncharacterized protein (DUF58 family)